MNCFQFVNLFIEKIYLVACSLLQENHDDE
jgi:hypothetical protein